MIFHRKFQSFLFEKNSKNFMHKKSLVFFKVHNNSCYYFESRLTNWPTGKEGQYSGSIHNLMSFFSIIDLHTQLSLLKKCFDEKMALKATYLLKRKVVFNFFSHIKGTASWKMANLLYCWFFFISFTKMHI